VFRPARRFSIPLNEPELFTASAEGQRFIAEDQLGLVEASARFLVNSFQLDLYARKAVPVIACPVLLQLAVHDAIIDPAKTKAYLELRLKPGLLTVNNYPNAHHTLEFEQDCPFVQDMLMWLQKLN
jgi:pimeloyl-ACP methyl ester carboxylesterase